MSAFLAKLTTNATHLPTTLAGAGAFLAALVQNGTVQQLAGISPKVAAIVTAVGAVGSALVLVFGTGATK